jgi:hypothetical protein
LILALTSTGGSIRDTGKEIYFSGFDSAARVTAERYAKIKWGQMKVIQENSIVFSPARKIGLER